MTTRTFNFGNIDLTVTGNGIKYNAFDISADEVKMSQPTSVNSNSTQQKWCDDPCCDKLNCDGGHAVNSSASNTIGSASNTIGSASNTIGNNNNSNHKHQSGIGHFGSTKNATVTMDLNDNTVIKNKNSNGSGTIGIRGDVKNANVNIKATGNLVMDTDPNMSLKDQLELLSNILAMRK